MSDNWIALIPKDPHFVPSEHHGKAAAAYLASIAPESDGIDVRVDNKIQFHDCGSNLESICCPRCNAAIDFDWWSDRMSDDFEGDGYQLGLDQTPCCHSRASLAELIYDFDQGFSRFIVEAMNPKIGKLSTGQLEKLRLLLGTEIRVIYRHI
ncbi:hypothetical protein [Verrucomicrobium sp. BvORR106]|uniref:hypothetical protein n=1 Tax=Verrucomicrobium sp. BvORR106 TaxID=1403819 RepID=UPI002240F9A6|nr:hypothetical protein [Verrucomicrobium sp. BvORR106]